VTLRAFNAPLDSCANSWLKMQLSCRDSGDYIELTFIKLMEHLPDHKIKSPNLSPKREIDQRVYWGNISFECAWKRCPIRDICHSKFEVRF